MKGFETIMQLPSSRLIGQVFCLFLAFTLNAKEKSCKTRGHFKIVLNICRN